ncbi:MAG: hypothetical protein Q4C53_03675 [Clostridia bacterium]|nr:hypothetical protein [Clostridia bacterium]
MWKALLKKQFLELNTFYFTNRKTGERRSKKGTAAMVALYALLFGVVGFAFYGMSMGMTGLLESGLSWLYFVVMGVMAIFFGVFGSVFNTYASLYRAKDNEMLLAMPIPPRAILFTRMLGVMSMALLYSGLVWIPACIRYWIFKGGAAAVLNPVLLLFVNTLLVTALTCLLGWVVAIVAGKFKNTKILTMVLTMAFFGLYYYASFNLQKIMNLLVASGDRLAETLKVSAPPLYALGVAANGNGKAMLLYSACAVAVFVLCLLLMAKNFVRIVTSSGTVAKTKYIERRAEQKSPAKALFLRELKVFTSSTTRMMNSGLGLLILPVVGVVALVKRGLLAEVMVLLRTEMPDLAGLVPGMVALVLMLIVTTNAISAPSVSLEGKNLWLIRSLPVDAAAVLKAKVRLHVALNILPLVVSAVLVSLAFGLEIAETVMIVLTVTAYMCFFGVFGVTLDLARPNLNWTNEVVPIKQGFAITVALFGGWGIVLAIGAAGYFLRSLVDPQSMLIAVFVLLVVATRLLRARLYTKGAERFDTL